MNTAYDKKIISLFLAIMFVVVGFGAFTRVVYAADYTIGQALIDGGLNVSTPPTGIDEIPSDLTPTQAQTIIQNIVNNNLVQEFVAKVNVADNNLQGLLAQCANNPPLTPSGKGCQDPAVIASNETSSAALRQQISTAQTALDAANQQLLDAIIQARKNQDPLIQQFRTQNQIQNKTDSINDFLGTTTTKVLTGFTGQSQTDAQNQAATPGAISPTDLAAAKQAQDNASQWLNSSGDQLALTMEAACVLEHPLTPGSAMMPCIAEAVYGFIYRPTAYALMGSGFLFDKFLSLSIQGPLISPVPGFIESTWKVVRDFSNMIFIFILLYTGIMTIFGQVDWKKTVLKVVFIALIINFSLFFTKVVIDAGNILAVGLLNAISTDSVSSGLAAAFQPQKFLSAAASTGDTSGGAAIVVFLVAAVVTGFAAYVFFKAAILFSKRLIIFWALMILSPFAFVSSAFPNASKFSEWLHELINQVFVAPVFLFFIYIIMTVIQADGGILSKMPSFSGGWFEALLAPVMVAMLLIKALQEALKYTEKMSGDTGAAFSNLVGGAMGLAGTVAIGAATGGVGLAGRATLGRVAQGLTDSGRLARVATGKSVLGDNAFARFAGRQAIAISDKARTGTWDVSGTGVGKSTLGKVASSVGAKITGPGASAKGGFEGSQKRQEDADLKFAKKLGVTGEEEKQMKLAAENANGTTAAKENSDKMKSAVEEAKKAADSTKTQGGIAHLANLEKLNKAMRDSEEAEKKALKLTEEAAKVATEQISTESERRKESYAKYVEGRTTLAKTGIYGPTYSHRQAEKTAGKVRAGETAKSEKDHAKKAKELAKELEEAKKAGADDKIIEHIEKKIKEHDEKE